MASAFHRPYPGTRRAWGPTKLTERAPSGTLRHPTPPKGTPSPCRRPDQQKGTPPQQKAPQNQEITRGTPRLRGSETLYRNARFTGKGCSRQYQDIVCRSKSPWDTQENMLAAGAQNPGILQPATVVPVLKLYHQRTKIQPAAGDGRSSTIVQLYVE